MPSHTRSGAATVLKRATSANSRPIIASPTKPSATEKFVQKPWSGWPAPITAKTSGERTTPRYAITQNTARVTRVTSCAFSRSRWGYVIRECGLCLGGHVDHDLDVLGSFLERRRPVANRHTP